MPTTRPLSDAEYQRLADFRYAIRRFLFFSEQAAAAESITPQQHQALLAIRGSSTEPNVANLATRLCLKHHTVVELLQRLEKTGLIRKRPSSEDRRAVILELTDEGRERLDRLAIIHRAELRHVGPEILNSLSKLSAS